MFVFLSYWKNSVGTEKRVRIIHGKRAIRIRAIEVICRRKTKKKENDKKKQTKGMANIEKRQIVFAVLIGIVIALFVVYMELITPGYKHIVTGMSLPYLP